MSLRLKDWGEEYTWNKVTSCLHNLLGAERWDPFFGQKNAQSLIYKSKLHLPCEYSSANPIFKCKANAQNVTHKSKLYCPSNKISKKFNFIGTNQKGSFTVWLFDFLTISCRVYNSLSKDPLPFMVHIKSSDLSFFDHFLLLPHHYELINLDFEIHKSKFRWVDLYGESIISCPASGLSARIQFVKASYWSSKRWVVFLIKGFPKSLS